MNYLLTFVVALVVLPSIASAQLSWTPSQQKWKKISVFGASPSASPAPITVTEAIAQDKFDNTILIHGVVSEVCKKMGCWMIIKEGTTVVRITFKNHDFTVPKNTSGKHVVIEGELSERTISEADARHYAEDAGKSKKQIAAIVGEQKEYVFEANGVRVYE